MTDAAHPQYTTAEVIRAYISLRDAIEQITDEAKAKTDGMKAQLAQLGAYLHKQLHDAGEKSKGTAEGTAFIDTVDFAKVSNWDNTIQYIIENEAWHFLKKDINKSAVKEYVELHGVPPPGVDYVTKEECKVRRK